MNEYDDIPDENAELLRVTDEIIAETPTDELETDLKQAVEDSIWCKLAMANGITVDGEGTDLRERYSVNLCLIVLIRKELEYRSTFSE